MLASMKLRAAVSAAALLASLFAARGAGAHPITVDGVAGEWLTRLPNADNLGLIARDAAKAGEYIWRDVANDARTDIASPEVIAEITGVQITGTPNGFAVLVRNVPGAVSVGKPIQIQLAVDLDRVAGSGNDFLAGFADTKVNEAARWEFLVQTLFGSGGQATVLDTSYNGVAAAQAAQGANGVEIFVPWSALGLAGPPSQPLRFSLATFRAEANDFTTDIGGPNVSNVIDAVTDYGDPKATAYPNTFVDVQDGVLDYFFDVFFDPQGEVYAPLVVQRFVSAPATGLTEWLTVENVSPVALPLDVFKVGDEETVDGTEGMLRFPVGSTLSAGASYTIAANAAQYQTTFAALPNAEIGNNVVAVPKMTNFTGWATGSVALANAGDELLVLDGSNTILDIATYGNVTYAGIVTKTPAPGSNIVLTRDAMSSDTDDCQVDFTAAAQCANDAACGSPCKQCLGNVCVPRPVGTSCADATVCNGAEVCDAAGTCVAGTPLDCDDGKACTTDSCDPVLGCANPPLPAGTSCDDGNVCNGTEACNAVGACVTVMPGMCDDGNPCTADSCDPVGGCMHTNLPMGTSCDADGDPCNGGATCNAVGVCTTVAAPTCDDNNPCTQDMCTPGVGCTATPLAANTPCGDGDACNGDELCNSVGACQSGTPLDCDDSDPCTQDTCDPIMGCDNPPAAMGTPCKDADACNGDESCDGAGTCVAGTAPGCDDQNDCTADACDAALGCTSTPVAAGTACSADPSCTGQTCDGSGVCGGGNCGTGGTGTGGSGTGGSATGGSGGSTTTASSSSSTSSSGEVSSSSSGGLGEDGGCGCRVAGAADDEPAHAAWLALGLLALARRRRRVG